jgi:VanZ family protein
MTDAPADARRRFAIVAAVLCGAFWLLAFATTHLPAGQVPDLGQSDKRLHFAGYFVLASLFAGALAAFGVSPRRRAVLGLAILPAYGAFDEVTQALVRRNPAVGDWLADAMGVVAAIALVETARWIATRRTARRPGKER